jgi:5-dehydro-2-deoxygluconokinase
MIAGDASEPWDVITMGRVGVDIYPEQIGVSLREVETFRKFLGGTATNVAVAAARYGRRCALITRTGRDPFGEFVHDALRRFNVDDRWVTAVAGIPTPVTFCELFPPDDFPIYFYRYPTAPDLQIEAAELDLDAIQRARVFWVTGTGLSQEPSRSATLAALEARGRNGITVLDMDYRPTFWSSPQEAGKWLCEALPLTTVAVGNLAECEVAVGEGTPQAVAAAIRALGVDLVIVKQGPAGVLATDGTRHVQVAALAVDVVNGLGAGDAFGGALCHGLLADWPLARTMQFCNAAGAIVASRLACADAMPDEAEVDARIEEQTHA